jgi:hypothetical protein
MQDSSSQHGDCRTRETIATKKIHETIDAIMDSLRRILGIEDNTKGALPPEPLK